MKINKLLNYPKRFSVETRDNELIKLLETIVKNWKNKPDNH